MSQIRDDDQYLRLPTNWPGQRSMRQLCASASGPFVWAAAAATFIEEGHDPIERLQSVLTSQAGSSLTSLDALYTTAIHTSGNWDDKSFRLDLISIVGILLVAGHPLTHIDVDKLHASERPSLYTISRLGSFVRSNSNGPVLILNPSLAEYLSSSSRCGHEPWFIDLMLHHRRLALLCLDHLDRSLKRNLCNLTVSARKFQA